MRLSGWLFEAVGCCAWSLLSAVVLQLVIIKQTHHHRSFYFILWIFNFFHPHHVWLIPSDAGGPQGLMRR